MNRRGFLKFLSVASPTVFIPSLIKVNWGIQRVLPGFPFSLTAVYDPLPPPLVVVPFLKKLRQEAIIEDPFLMMDYEETAKVEMREVPKKIYEKLNPGERIVLYKDTEKELVHFKSG